MTMYIASSEIVGRSSYGIDQAIGGPVAGNSTMPGRSVTSKVVAILLTFHDGNEHSLTEISRLTSLPLTTAHRMVTELAGWGVLERTDESKFRLGLSIKTMGSRRSFTPAVLESARRVLEDLVTATRTTARLGVLTGTDVAFIEKRCDHTPVTTFAQSPRLPAHATALGKALLAFSSPEMLDLIIANGLKYYTLNTLTDPEQLRQHLAGIRLTRVAVSRWELKPGASEVAAPVFGSGGLAVAALELTVPDLRTDLHMATCVLTVAARGLSRELAACTHISCFAPVTEQHPSLRQVTSCQPAGCRDAGRR
jgi:DNA-binding IclR family transcriptional regulator